MADIIGQSFGRYHILEQLGEGGMATVYKAYDTRLERDVAIKIIRKGAFPPEQLEHILKRFERESKALAGLSHTNIVKVMDYGEYEGSPYMVLEYLPGGTLKQRLGIPIPWREAMEIILPVVRALEYAHGRGIVHRDIKPSNILLTQSNQPLLTDFGIAKILENRELTTLTGTGVGVGTPEYMAPEQWTGQADIRSDVYSMGVVLYELVTGRKPYIADTPAAILLKQATEPLPRPTQYVSDLPEGVEKLLIKSLARDPRERYQDMSELAAAMEKISMGRMGDARAPKVKTALPPKSETYATIQQDDSRATAIQETTWDSMSMSNMVSPARTLADPIPKVSKKKGFPVWAIIGIAGIVIVAFIGLSSALGIFDRPATPVAFPPSTEWPGEPILPTQEERQPASTETRVVPTEPPVYPTQPPPPTYTPLPTYTPFPTATPVQAKSPPVIDSIGVPDTIACDGTRYDVPIYFRDADGDTYQIYWELVSSSRGATLYSTLREFSIAAQTQMSGAVYMDWIQWNMSGDTATIRVNLYDRSGLKGSGTFTFRCSN